MVGHIRQNCFKLKSHEHMSDSSYFRNIHERLLNMVREVLNKLNKLKNHAVQSHMHAPSFRKVWVPKVNTVH